MEYRDLGFPLKMMLGYLVGILLLTLLYSISIGHLSTISGDYDNLVKDSWRQLSALQSLHAAGQQLRFNIESDATQVESDLRLIDYWFLNYLKFSRRGASADISILVREFHAFRLQTLQLIYLIKKKDGQAKLSPDYDDFIKKYNAFMGRIYVEIERSKNHVEISEIRFLRRFNELLFLNTVLAPLSFLFLYVYGYFISNHTGLRLRKFLEALKKILAGDYKQRVNDPSQDEIGQIAQGVNSLVQRLGKK